MIPSTPRRTWLFLGASLLLYFAPDLLVPESWTHTGLYTALEDFYLGALVLLGFLFGPAICHALVVQKLSDGPLRAAVDGTLLRLAGKVSPLPAITLVDQPTPFVLTAGLLPRQCQVFVSSALVGRLSPSGLHFLLARAAVHASWRQRMAAVIPILVFTLLPAEPDGLAGWLAVLGFLVLWLMIHWGFELDADRQAARLMGEGAREGLLNVHMATASPLGRLTPQAPMDWRLRAVSGYRRQPA